MPSDSPGLADLTDPRNLRAGYATIKARGPGHFAGALRLGERVAWRCDEKLRHDHIGTALAITCAEAELQRRRAGAREVFVLLHCEDEGLWWDPALGAAEESPGDGRCPRCYKPLIREKVFVLEREPA
jgi:hypothetical protein